MTKELERDLGLYAVFTVSVGAMVGSGIFVLPGKAAKIAGPAVILAYALAGIIVLPAALSKAEMATAMPESGGTYLYIDRAMGPRMGTVAGIGAWFSLVFKTAFALVGLGAYLLLFVDVRTRPVALALAVLLLGVNVVGVKQTGRLQAAIVTVVLLVLVVFVGDGITFVESANYHPFFPHGSGGVLAGAGFVFVSYAGVTKIASVAEEVEDPGRNIPIGILASIGLMILVYTAVVFVVVGVTTPDTLHGTLTPMAASAAEFMGEGARLFVTVIAVLALTSMANAGILSSSRYPLALARDDLAPLALGEVSDRFSTPIVAIGFTGVVLLALIAAVPVIQLAKLASAFQLLVFLLENVALVAFRESDLDWYEPEFVAPGYPWVQLFGIGGCLVLLTQMGPLPLVGAAGIVAIGVVWYRLYGRARTEREGAALDAIRRTSGGRAIERTREALASAGTNVLVPVTGTPDRDTEATLVSLAVSLVGDRDGSVDVVEFEEVPEQLTLSSATDTEDDEAFERQTAALAENHRVPVSASEVVTHDTNRAVTNYAADHGVDVLLGEWHPDRWRAELLGTDVDWYMRHAPCDLVFVRNRGLGDVDEVAVIADRGPFDPLEVVVADAVALANDATIRFLSAVDDSVSDEQMESEWEYLRSLADLCDADTSCSVLRSDDREGALVTAAGDADLAVVGTAAHTLVYNALFGSLADRLVERLSCTVLVVHSRKPRRHTFLRAVLDRFVF